MIIILISIIVGIVLSIISNKNSGYADLGLYIIGGIVSSCVGAIIGIGLAFCIPADIEQVNSNLQIESLQDGSEMSGRFFLGTGSFEGKMKYTFYYKDGDYYKLKQIDHKDAKIKYSEESPHVVVIKDIPTASFINWFALDILNEKYIINIPKGTIKNDYNLDAR